MAYTGSMYIKSLLLFLISLQLRHAAKRPPPSLLQSRPLYVRARYVQLCDDNPPDSYAENITIVYDRTKIFVSGVGVMNRPVEQIHKIIFTIRRCNDAAEAEQNCELVQTWRFGRESCLMVVQKDMLWSAIFLAFHPQLKCPLQKGTYEYRNGTVDLNLLQQTFRGVPLEKYFWRNRIEVHDHKMFICFSVGVNFFRGKH